MTPGKAALYKFIWFSSLSQTSNILYLQCSIFICSVQNSAHASLTIKQGLSKSFQKTHAGKSKVKRCLYQTIGGQKPSLILLYSTFILLSKLYKENTASERCFRKIVQGQVFLSSDSAFFIGVVYNLSAFIFKFYLTIWGIKYLVYLNLFVPLL